MRFAKVKNIITGIVKKSTPSAGIFSKSHIVQPRYFYYYCRMSEPKDCVFCKIIDKEIPTDIVFENDLVFAFKDINPKAPVHILIIPKRHLTEIDKLTKEETFEILQASSEISQDLEIKDTGFRLALNYGEDSGQEIKHLHFHLLGGKPSTCLY